MFSPREENADIEASLSDGQSIECKFVLMTQKMITLIG